ncbi:hypothetical protein [Streptomyces sp. URMC 125]|uniref:hypothetical protein n=1 Tax=Streptomyces sp. URMC 125 TaxID=3423419 RepID=UPI003F1AED84
MLEPVEGFIDEMLRENAQAPRKQRDTIDRIVQRLAAEQGFEQASYSTVRAGRARGSICRAGRGAHHSYPV